MNLDSRLKRLERLAPAASPLCPLCGLPPAWARREGPVTFEIGWHAPGETKPPPCPACGQTNVIWIEFDRAG
jgi:hypothetical protein